MKIEQNKIHFAAHGHTAAEIVFECADAQKPEIKEIIRGVQIKPKVTQFDVVAEKFIIENIYLHDVALYLVGLPVFSPLAW